MTTRFDPWEEADPTLVAPDLSPASGNNQVTGYGTVGDDAVDLRLPGMPDNYDTDVGDDIIVGNETNNHIMTEQGNDVAWGWDGDDFIEAGDGDDVVYAMTRHLTVMLSAIRTSMTATT